MTDAAIHSDPLPVGSLGRRAGGWYGMLAVIMTEGALFAYLLFSYYYFAVQYGREFLPPELPKFLLSLPNTVILLASSVAAWFAERGLHMGRKDNLVWGLAATIALGVLFMVIQGAEWAEKPFTMAFYGLKVLDDLYHHKPASLDHFWVQDSQAPIPSFIDTGATLIDKNNVANFRRASDAARSGN